MYLLVFATLVISMMSVYTQVMAVEAARLAANQTGVAKELTLWHAAAMSVATSLIDSNAVANTGKYNLVKSTGCSLSFNVWGGGIQNCPTPVDTSGNSVNTVCPAGIVTAGPANSYQICQIYNPVSTKADPVHLPPDYAASTYQFYSVLYQDAGAVDHVITFVPPTTPSPANPDGFLTLETGGTRIGLTSGDLTSQLKHVGIPGYMLGIVKNGILITGGLTQSGQAGSGFSYTLPLNGIIPDGSIAIVSSPDGF